MAFLELIKTVGSAFGTLIKPIGGKDTSGNAREIITTAEGDLLTSPFPPKMSAAMGFSTGKGTFIQNSFHFFNTGTGIQKLTAGGYTEQTTGSQRSVVSTSASDTNAAGTGVRKVYISFVTGAGALGAEVVNLNGTTPVNTVSTDIKNINFFCAADVGSTNLSVGTISLKAAAGGGGSTITTIPALETDSDSAVFFTPSDKKLYLDSLLIGTSDSGFAFVKYTNLISGGLSIYREVFNVFLDNNNPTFKMADNIIIVEPNGKLIIEIDPTNNNKIWYLTWSGWLR